MACLDTSFLVDLQRQHSEFGRRAAEKAAKLTGRGELLVTTRINVAEMYLGVELAGDRRRELESVRHVLSDLEILPFDDRAAWHFARSMAHLRRIGRPVGEMDVLIAACAAAFGHILVTRNPAHFTYIPHLQVESY